MKSVLNELLPVLNARRDMAHLYQTEVVEICRREAELTLDKLQQTQSKSPVCLIG